jgi:ribosomal protein L7Ae-like RNA K-turn-binding protein
MNQRGFTGSKFGIVQSTNALPKSQPQSQSLPQPYSYYIPTPLSAVAATKTSTIPPSIPTSLPTVSSKPPPSAKKTSVMANAMNLVRKAAFDKDPDAIATIVASLTQSDLALLRLLAFKYERKLQSTRATTSTSANNAASSSKGVLPLGVSFDKGRKKSVIFKSGKRKMASDLLGLKDPINEGFNLYALAEKARAKALRTALRDGKSQSEAHLLGEEAAALVKKRPDQGKGEANHHHPYMTLLKQVERQRLIRSWIRAQITSIEGGDKRAISSNTTAAHAAYLRAGGGSKGVIKEKILPATIGSSKTSLRAAGRGGAGGDGAEAGEDQVYSSKLSRVKKLLLKERISRWLATNTAASAEYDLVKEKREMIDAAVLSAESNARKSARREAERLIRLKEHSRFMKMISLGKIALQSERVLVPLPEGTQPSAPQKYKLVAPDPNKHADLLASKVEIGKRRLRKMVIDLLRKGLVESPRVAGEVARKRAEEEFDAKKLMEKEIKQVTEVSEDGMNSTSTTTTTKAKVDDNDEAIMKARTLASNPLTNSTPLTSVTKLIPKGVPVRSLVYVDQEMDATLDTMASEMISTAYFLQTKSRAAVEDEEGGGGGGGGGTRRIVTGLREVIRGCRSNKIKFVIVAPNIDPGGGDGGLDSQVVEAVDAAREAEVPLIFALSRKRIGLALGASFRPSVVGFLSVENLNGQHVAAAALASTLRKSWAAKKAAGGGLKEGASPLKGGGGVKSGGKLNAFAAEWVPSK